MEKIQKHTHFPLFVDTRGKKAVIIGGGNIALRRIKTLCSFCFEILVVAPEIKEEIEALAQENSIVIIREPYNEKYLEDAFFVVAVTNNRKVNQTVGMDCKAGGIPVSVADKREECTFFFPAIVADETVIGVCGNGRNHGVVKERAEGIRRWLASLVQD